MRLNARWAHCYAKYKTRACVTTCWLTFYACCRLSTESYEIQTRWSCVDFLTLLRRFSTISYVVTHNTGFASHFPFVDALKIIDNGNTSWFPVAICATPVHIYQGLHRSKEETKRFRLVQVALCCVHCGRRYCMSVHWPTCLLSMYWQQQHHASDMIPLKTWVDPIRDPHY